ncbi:3-methyladenine DNA glycosylase [Pseudomonas rubra]|uniref:3-methyladenine DNA glycosylase n=1 Tax=Pseudomonas rubra TaxID=2942627 RepID=A0ABT5PFW6_9PSED|nr:3-methyladenine DNA glycosylase [Pseudomonas rubra]MDD1016893.1 3-methyladenine DNA glycosylase [Pseudomonas rubra]MDD1039361.1 3-methyladenine DNA glycosylase [Pseudomonas rubra]MDD1157857.1 3-methyladenine DNA glycosylase [Pseudomonas rubra]
MDIQTIGKKFVSVSVNGAFGPHKLVGPEQNVHGLILRTVNFNATYTVVVSATPPADTFDNSKTIAFTARSRTEPFMVPAGLGVYLLLGNDYNRNINVTWDYLNADGTVA